MGITIEKIIIKKIQSTSNRGLIDWLAELSTYTLYANTGTAQKRIRQLKAEILNRMNVRPAALYCFGIRRQKIRPGRKIILKNKATIKYKPLELDSLLSKHKKIAI